MPSLTLEEFLNVVQRSGLLTAEQLTSLVDSLRREPSRDAAQVAANLLEQGAITSWQKKNLLLGKSRGFFLGRYRLLRHLGTGGMSSVFLARHTLFEREAAIKVLPPARTKSQSFLERFEREAWATARMSHPNIVRVFDIDSEDDTHYIVMEYVAGRDLKAIVKADGPLTLPHVAHYVAQAAMGLQHAHERGLVHRDIKPANLVVNDDALLKVLDLGLARIDNDDELASLTIDNAEGLMGTADYLAPEQARNAHTVDHRADIYSLGCTFYFLLTGHAPFTEGTIAERILKHQSEPPRDVRAEREDCPHALANVCMTMLAKSPEDRFQAAGQVAELLHKWLIANGHFLHSATYALGVNPTSPALPPLKTDVAESQLALPPEPIDDPKKPRSEIRRSTTIPVGLWVFLTVGVVVCVVLVVVLLKSR